MDAGPEVCLRSGVHSADLLQHADNLYRLLLALPLQVLDELVGHLQLLLCPMQLQLSSLQLFPQQLNVVCRTGAGGLEACQHSGAHPVLLLQNPDVGSLAGNAGLQLCQHLAEVLLLLLGNLQLPLQEPNVDCLVGARGCQGSQLQLPAVQKRHTWSEASRVLGSVQL